jgi:hypothetical protein
MGGKCGGVSPSEIIIYLGNAGLTYPSNLYTASALQTLARLRSVAAMISR